MSGTAKYKNLQALAEAYLDFSVSKSFEGLGYRARRHNEDGRPVGREMAAMTMDELAARMDESRAGIIVLPPGEAAST